MDMGETRDNIRAVLVQRSTIYEFKLGGNHLTQRKTEVYSLVEYHKECGRQRNEFRL